METQQLSVLNVRNSVASESRRSSASSSEGAAPDDQQTPFDEQLNQQIEQGKVASKSENIHNNQQDNEGQARREQVSGEPSESSPEEQGMQQSVDLDGYVDDAEIVPSGISTRFDLATLQPDVSLHTDITAMTESTPGLPQDGNVLPPPTMTVAVNQNQNVITSLNSAQPGSDDPVEMDILNLSRQVQLTQEVSSQNQSLNPRSAAALPGLVENSGQAAKQFSDMMMNQGQRSQSQAMPAGEELPVELMSLASQSSRLQRVPQITASSAGLLTANAATASLIPDMQPMSGNTPSQLAPALSANVASPQWSQQMTSQVALMLNGGIQHAQIKLNPAHLGPMEIKLAINDDQASINFVAQHAPVRDAIDNALPRLREMLEEQGLNLADVDVSTQSEQQAKEEGEGDSTNQVDGVAESVLNDSESNETVQSVSVESGVSLYA